jgi:hypothetical protein
MMSQIQNRTAPLTSAPTADDGLLDAVVEETARLLDAMSRRYTVALEQPGLMPLRRSFLTAKGIANLKAALNENVMEMFMSLMDSDLGFLTDRKPGTKGHKEFGPYGPAVVKHCIVTALLNGFFPVNNEFNIIAGKFYGAQAGWIRKVKEIDGITDLCVMPGIPRLAAGQMCCRVAATWKYKGQPMSLTDHEGKPGREFGVRNDSASTVDNLTGKALRKAYKAIFEYITGTTHTESDEPEGHVHKPTVRDLIEGTNGGGHNGAVAAAPAEPPPSPGLEAGSMAPPSPIAEVLFPQSAQAPVEATPEREAGVEDEDAGMRQQDFLSAITAEIAGAKSGKELAGLQGKLARVEAENGWSMPAVKALVRRREQEILQASAAVSAPAQRRKV